jgi:hypothetical protein
VETTRLAAASATAVRPALRTRRRPTTTLRSRTLPKSRPDDHHRLREGQSAKTLDRREGGAARDRALAITSAFAGAPAHAGNDQRAARQPRVGLEIGRPRTPGHDGWVARSECDQACRPHAHPPRTLERNATPGDTPPRATPRTERPHAASPQGEPASPLAPRPAMSNRERCALRVGRRRGRCRVRCRTRGRMACSSSNPVRRRRGHAARSRQARRRRRGYREWSPGATSGSRRSAHSPYPLARSCWSICRVSLPASRGLPSRRATSNRTAATSGRIVP